MKTFQIADRIVGPGAPALLVADVAQAHDGSLGTAHAYIDAIADAGADAVKFQTHLADYESTLDEPFRVRFTTQDDTRYAYWKRMEFTAPQWGELAAHAADRGLLFLSSAFCPQAVDLLARVGMPAWKVGAGEFRSFDLVEAMTRHGKPIILSTGMSRRDEIDAMVRCVRERDVPLAVVQCVSRYPSTFAQVGLNLLPELADRFDCPVGLSDHSGSIYPALAAMARGAHLVEVHATFDRRLFGPDTSASVTMAELKILADGRDAIACMDAHPADKDAVATELETMRGLFSKSLAPLAPLAAGTVLKADMLMPKKPGTGIPPTEIESLVGRRLARDVTPQRLLAREDLEDE